MTKTVQLDLTGLQPVGQSTAIEQSRAAAEVAAAVSLAKRFPRDVAAAEREMERSCASPALAARAFFSYRRGDSTISGPSVHLARELARCWRNVQYGVVELARDDAKGESEMQAYAWDVENNTKVEHKFIVKHQRDQRGGPKKLTELRDIYENNSNNAARRLREAIFAVLPPQFTETAKTMCHATVSGVSGEELSQGIERAVKAFARRGVTEAQLIDKLGVKRDEWTGEEYAILDVLFGSLKRGEITIDEAFPPAEPTMADLIGTPQPLADDEPWPDVAQPPTGQAEEEVAP